jgi:hypothetical protein
MKTDPLALAKTDPEALSNEPRYFSDGTSVWKFQAGREPQIRDLDQPEWEESSFVSLEEFLQTPGEVKEIKAWEAEP